MFNGHMDTSNTGSRGISYRHRLQATRRSLRTVSFTGLGIYNMKGRTRLLHTCGQALHRAGVKLKGDAIIAAVVGEIEENEWGEYKGKEYRGYGYGTHYLVNHGVLPDMCILGEPTDMHLVLEHFGSMWVRISCSGIYVHTAFCEGREK